MIHDALLQDGLKGSLRVLKHRHTLAGGLALQIVRQTEREGEDREGLRGREERMGQSGSKVKEDK